MIKIKKLICSIARANIESYSRYFLEAEMRA